MMFFVLLSGDKSWELFSFSIRSGVVLIGLLLLFILGWLQLKAEYLKKESQGSMQPSKGDS